MDFGLTLSPREPHPHVSVNASYCIRDDGKSHSVIALGLGSCYFSFRSKKQKILCQLSTEAELNAPFDAVKPLTWMRELLEDLGYAQLATIVQHSAIERLQPLWQVQTDVFAL
jgi:hypothetical protein